MTFDWSIYKGNLGWLPQSSIYLTRHGSHAYGTSLPTSDLDIRGIAIAPRPCYLGFLQEFEQAVQSDPDLQIFELRKFLRLACDANPNVLELLYTDPEDHLLVTPPMERLFENRALFLSRKAKHTFSGYATSQLKRINVHYRWLKHPPTAPPTRAEFGLPERTVIPADQLTAAQSSIQKELDSWSWKDIEGLDPASRQALKDQLERTLVKITGWNWTEHEDKLWKAAAGQLGYDTNFIQLLDIERQYTARLREWQQYQEWKRTRNPQRAALEEKFGYDTKHALHLVRLLRMGREILTEGKVLVRRPDAEELLQIRAGAWSYEELVAWAEAQDKDLGEVMKTSPLPNAPDRTRIDAICMELVESSFEKNHDPSERPTQR
jgi:predicted nucleotidyltransferase